MRAPALTPSLAAVTLLLTLTACSTSPTSTPDQETPGQAQDEQSPADPAQPNTSAEDEQTSSTASECPLTAEELSQILDLPLIVEGACRFAEADENVTYQTTLQIQVFGHDEVGQDEITAGRELAPDLGKTEVEDLGGAGEGYLAVSTDEGPLGSGELISVEDGAVYTVHLDFSRSATEQKKDELRSIIDAIRAKNR